MIEINRIQKTFEMYCDSPGCSNSHFATCDFNMGIEQAKDSGWIIRNSPSGWEHFCPGCANPVRA